MIVTDIHTIIRRLGMKVSGEKLTKPHFATHTHTHTKLCVPDIT